MIPLVRFENVSKSFGGLPAVDRLSLDIRAGEFFALLGPSGCGKTTLLRLLAGFERPDSGRILLNGEDVSRLPPHRRAVNMMFQNYALFPHLTVEGNIAFGLKQEKLPRLEIAQRVRDMLNLVRLTGLEVRKPDQLSGGQRQRVALARALVKRPKVFLLDEPMAALDKKLRVETQSELVALQKALGVTFVIVTHDQEEAMTMAHRIGLMNRGQLVQVADPFGIYDRPRSRWVAEFIGDVNVISGHVVSSDGATMTIESVEAGRFRVENEARLTTGNPVFVALRPENLQLAPQEADGRSENVWRGRIAEVGYFGDVSIYKVRLEKGLTVKVKVINTRGRKEPGLTAGDDVQVGFAPQAAVIMSD
ncbi:MAG: ABC transporter ATP-binding protein [Pseudorhodoplanes sp.]